ncbi:TPA: hypothetical protein QDE31_15295 [Burkholderia cenocepacia]|nr:hypothetical protein [Burkholderia cenocepacia]
MPGAGCRVPGAGCRVPGAGCRVPGAKSQEPGAASSTVAPRAPAPAQNAGIPCASVASLRAFRPTRLCKRQRHAKIAGRLRAAPARHPLVSFAARNCHVVIAQDWFDGFRFRRRDVPCARDRHERPH